MNRRSPIVRTIALLSLGFLAASPMLAQESGAPCQSGRSVLEAMHSAYAGTWYHTLTFVQRTIVERATRTDTSTWYESLKGPALLRIDTGDPAIGNGILYTADSSVSMRRDTVARRSAGGNEFLPLIMGVYLQPIDSTIRQLKSFGFDLNRCVETKWQGRDVAVVGTESATDSVSPQFWIDRGNWVVLRMRGTVGGGGRIDVTTGGYQKAGKGWLATQVVIRTPTITQHEDYRLWTVDRDLPDAFFDPAHWATIPHWLTTIPAAGAGCGPIAAEVCWFRASAEYRALTLQVYRDAGDHLAELARGKSRNGWAVILDADETVLDNSEYQQRLVVSGRPFSDSTWALWVNQHAAGAVPGAVDFIRRVQTMGGRVAIVTNRAESLCDATRQNLATLSVHPDLLLCQPGVEIDKNPRFERIARGTAVSGIGPLVVVAWIGDNIQDFPNLHQSVRDTPAALDSFGRRFFLLPNPMYGSWQQ
ncbi:MAG TPA: HAD family acid phosphatase [Gemmatimonadales bacterium]|nr:HAD family acid phosphatase [Gemmatimonadales bacterium]